MTPQPWKLLASKSVLDSRWLRVLDNTYEDRGREIDEYYVVERADFVLVVAIDPSGNVLLVHQYRAATEEFYLALPAGYIGAEETTVQAGARELEEETGIVGTNWRDVGHLDPLPGYIRSRAFVTRCDVPDLSGIDFSGRGDDQEDNTVRVMHRDQVRSEIAAGEHREMQFVAAFLLAEAAER